MFVLLGGFGRGDPRGITLVVRAVVCLSGGALVGLSGGDTTDPVCSTDSRDGTASVSGVLVEYGEWLDRQRGLAPITIDNYCWNVEQFLGALPQPTQVSVSLLDAGTVTAFMVEYCRDRNTNSVKSMARSVRSFLRFAHATGRISVGLWGAVPVSGSTGRAFANTPNVSQVGFCRTCPMGPRRPRFDADRSGAARC